MVTMETSHPRCHIKSPLPHQIPVAIFDEVRQTTRHKSAVFLLQFLQIVTRFLVDVLKGVGQLPLDYPWLVVFARIYAGLKRLGAAVEEMGGAMAQRQWW